MRCADPASDRMVRRGRHALSFRILTGTISFFVSWHLANPGTSVQACGVLTGEEPSIASACREAHLTRRLSSHRHHPRHHRRVAARATRHRRTAAGRRAVRDHDGPAFLVSGFYHTPNWPLELRMKLRRLDRSMIYLFMAGGFTPYFMVIQAEQRGSRPSSGPA